MLTCGQRGELFEADDLIYALLLSALHRRNWRNVGIEHNAQHVEKIIKNAVQRPNQSHRTNVEEKLAAGIHNTKRIATVFLSGIPYTHCMVLYSVLVQGG